MLESTDLKLQVAAKAVIVNNKDEVLLLRESKTGPNNTKAGQWGLVGGRLDPGEAFLDGLRREVMEETGLEIEPIKPLYVGEWRPVIHGVPHQIIAIFMHCRAKTTDVKVSEEHDQYAWVDPAKRVDYIVMEPDDEVIDALARNS